MRAEKRHNIGGHVTSERSFRTRPVRPVDPMDRVEIVVMQQGRQTSVFLGTARGECLGVLEGDVVVQMASEILKRRLKPTPTWSAWSSPGNRVS